MGKGTKTIGIVTIDDYINYGNRLQNYALTRLLEAQGFRVVNGIQVYTKQDYVICSPGILKMFVKLLMPYQLTKKRFVPKVVPLSSLLKRREVRFMEFVNRYTSIRSPIVVSNHRQVMKIFNRDGIDFFVAGSDQVWNPMFGVKAYMFLTFAPKNKRFSFAASIGVDTIPAIYERQIRRYFNDMKYLSVREQRAVEVIKELTGRDADLTFDPTLLLEPEQWQHVVKKPEITLEAKFICTYFLGDTPEAVNIFAQEKGLPVYALNSEEHQELFVLDPGEFLYMIQNASYVLTDSFHAVAFSIKFNKEFYVFDRKQNGVSDMFSRIETITKRFGLENRIQNRGRIVEQEPVRNWNEIEKELVAEKNKSMGKLLEAMGL